MNAKLKGDLSVETLDLTRRIIITQKRYNSKTGSPRNVVVCLTVGEAKLINEQLGKHIALMEALAARDVLLRARESAR